MITFSISVFAYLDDTFVEQHEHGAKLIETLFFGKFGLQKIFNLKGLNMRVDFQVIKVQRLGYPTSPSSRNLG